VCVCVWYMCVQFLNFQSIILYIVQSLFKYRLILKIFYHNHESNLKFWVYIFQV